MAESNDFIIERAIATRAAQAIVTAAWQWEEHTDAQWEADIQGMIDQKEEVADKEAIKQGDAGVLDVKLDLLHDRTVVALGLFKVKHRDNAAMTHALKPLSAKGGSRGAILEEGLEFESQWEKWDPAWVPRPTWTLANFKALRLEGLALKEPYAASKGVWREAAGNYNELGEALNKLLKAWYEAATTVFAEGTSEGDMIRNTVPTTYSPPPDLPLPEQAEVTLVDVVGTDGMEISYSATYATEFDVYLQSLANPAFVLVAANRTETGFTFTGLVSGDYQAKVVGKNATGAGPESEVAGFTIA